MKLFVFLSLFLPLFFSCRKLVQNEFPDFSPVPVVNGILVADSLIKIHVSLAEKLDTNKLGWIDNARVDLYTNGQYTETFSYREKGFYSGTTIVEPGKTYSCEVEIPGFVKVKCTDSIPLTTTLTEIGQIDIAGKDEEGASYSSIVFTFNDNQEQTNYYEVKIILERVYSDLINNLDPVLLNEGLPVSVFSDELIQNGTNTMTINYYNSNYPDESNGGYSRLLPVVLELRSISYDYYKYTKDLYIYETGRHPTIVGGVVTPYQLYSNVEDGLGIFAGYSRVISDTIFPETPKN